MFVDIDNFAATMTFDIPFTAGLTNQYSEEYMQTVSSFEDYVSMTVVGNFDMNLSLNVVCMIHFTTLWGS